MKVFSLITALAIIVLAGWLHGQWTERWVKSDDLNRAVERLQNVPLQIGDWLGKDQTLDADQVEKAQLAGYLQRRYKNRVNGAEVTVLLMCGQPGPISVHTPDICYSGAGFQLTAPESPYPTKSPKLIMGVFRLSQALTPESLCILWSWNANGSWKTPVNPRWEFARARALYKLYVICDMPTTSGLQAEDPRAQFIELLLPELERDLFPDTAS